MIGDSLRHEVEDFYAQTRLESPLFLKASSGELSARAIGTYLENLRYLVSHTPPHLRLAQSISEARGIAPLADFFADKHGEEVGHDKWAEADVEAISRRFAFDGQFPILPSMTALVEYIAATIRTDPTLYLSYIFFSEYFTVLAGPELIHSFETNCDIPSSMVSVLGNHAELDREHIVDDLTAVDRLVDDEKYRGLFHLTLRKAMAHFTDFAHEVGTFS